MTATPLRLLLAATVVAIAGRLLDARWHATHDEFEGASEQLEAHWLAWLGVAGMVGAAAYALRREGRRVGYVLVLLGGAVYATVGTWHFIAHANGEDPEVAHVFLALANLLLLSGVVVALAQRARRRSP
ncbi:MAG: hypothetical protein M3141_05865, partial [Actinomycetota bacterium]|nr:hypothetical protein [Actinomycetota bacterium]